jgi:branched-chain amino acid transport system ATP-binding protein
MSDIVLTAQNLTTGYHGHPLVHDVNVAVERGQIVALLGPNGAGKTTTLMTLAGELPVISGEVLFHGDLETRPFHSRARRGLAFVTEERAVFMGLSTWENLRVGRCDMGVALQIFPELVPLLRRKAGLLSGGEQQMLALARAIARRPTLLFIDELSLGLAPLAVERLIPAVRAVADSGTAVLLVEQQMNRAISLADYVYVMRQGRIVLQGRPDQVAKDSHLLEAAYLDSN